MHRRVLPLVAALIALVAVGCAASPAPSSFVGDGGDDAGVPPSLGSGGSSPEELDASLATRVRARFDLCGGQEGCHVSGVAGLAFPPGDELVGVIDVPSTERPELDRVKPGDPLASYLFLKVRGDGGIEGGSMPPIGASDPRIAATIFAWIEAGAPAH